MPLRKSLRSVMIFSFFSLAVSGCFGNDESESGSSSSETVACRGDNNNCLEITPAAGISCSDQGLTYLGTTCGALATAALSRCEGSSEGYTFTQYYHPDFYDLLFMTNGGDCTAAKTSIENGCPSSSGTYYDSGASSYSCN